MKNIFLSILIALFVLPAFTPWMPHGVIHAFHDHQTAHHGLEENNKGIENQQAFHHPIQFDAVTYFSDYLHVELQNPDQIQVKKPIFDTQSIDFSLTAVLINPLPHYEMASLHSRVPPDWRRHKSNNIPLYISTQRLRI